LTHARRLHGVVSTRTGDSEVQAVDAQNAPFVLARILHIPEKLFLPTGTPYISFMLECPSELQIARCVRNKSLALIAHTILMLLADRYRRKAHNAAWYDSPNDEPSNLPFALKNPFGKRNPRGSTRTNNDQHLQETGVVGLKGLKPIKTDGQDYRSTTSLDRRRELGLDEQKQHSATTPNVTSAHDFQNADFKIRRSTSPANEEISADKVEQVPERKEPDSTRSGIAVGDRVGNEGPLDTNHEGPHHRNVGALDKMKSWGKSKNTSGEIDDPDAKKKEKRVYTPMSQVRATILNSWINVLLIACW
jgi:hypothetical protein